MSEARGDLGKDSRQYAQLRRKLSISLAVNWLAYTVIFLIVAVVLNFTLVPSLANEIADSTSEWRVWYYEDYPLERCLEELGVSYVGVSSNIQEPAALDAAVQDDVMQEDIATDGIEVDAPHASAVNADGFADESVSELVVDESTGETVLVISDYPKEDIGPYTTLILRDRKEKAEAIETWSDYFTTTLRQLQQDAIRVRFLDDLDYEVLRNMQILYGDYSVMARDLTTYNLVKQFKYPIAICLYLVGCVVLIFSGYGRAMRYFAELSNAVGRLMTDKEQAIELSPALSITQNVLNAIRLESLADERAAKQAEQRKDELVAYLAHDMKTPLTSIMGYLMMLEEAPDMPAEQRCKYVGIAAEKAQRLEMLMDEFFEITRYNLQAMSIERSNVDAKLLLDQIADEFFPDAQAKGIVIGVEAPADKLIFVDADKFARALGNIMRNAIAYADADSKVRLSAIRDDDAWTIKVENQGREISEAHLQSIFEKFYREDAARSSKSGGAGLGLAIAKEIVVAHGGTIAAESKNGTTIFTIVMPLA